MNLELKHLVYQNFKPLQVYFGKGNIDIISDIDYCDGIIGFLNRDENYLLFQKPFKLILKPISDLDDLIQTCFNHISSATKEEQFLIDLFCYENISTDECISDLDLTKLPYECVDYIFKNHYDFFDLIPAGLAISIHDVEQVIA